MLFSCNPAESQSRRAFFIMHCENLACQIIVPFRAKNCVSLHFSALRIVRSVAGLNQQPAVAEHLLRADG